MKEIKNNLKISIFNLFFILPCLIGTGLAIADAVLHIKQYSLFYENNVLTDFKDNVNIFMPLNTVYTYWIGGSNCKTTSYIFFYYIFLVAFIPSIYIIYKCKKGNTLLTKNSIYEYLSSFITSGLIVFIPLAVNFICNLMFIPADTPDSVYDMYYGVTSSTLFNKIFYNYPIIYELIYMLILFLMGGFIGCLAYAITKLFKGFWAFLLLPDIVLLILTFTDNNKQFFYSISPIKYCSTATGMFYNYRVLRTELIFLILATLVIFLINKFKKIKHEEA